MAHPNEILFSAPAGLDAPWGQALFTLSQWDEPNGGISHLTEQSSHQLPPSTWHKV